MRKEGGVRVIQLIRILFLPPDDFSGRHSDRLKRCSSISQERFDKKKNNLEAKTLEDDKPASQEKTVNYRTRRENRLNIHACS